MEYTVLSYNSEVRRKIYLHEQYGGLTCGASSTVGVKALGFRYLSNSSGVSTVAGAHELWDAPVLHQWGYYSSRPLTT